MSPWQNPAQCSSCWPSSTAGPLDGLLEYGGESLAASRGLSPQQVHSKVQPAIFGAGCLAAFMSWMTHGVLTPVQLQKQCGACRFSSLQFSVEGAWAQISGTPVSLTEQQFVDCDHADHGCNGRVHGQCLRVGRKKNNISPKGATRTLLIVKLHCGPPYPRLCRFHEGNHRQRAGLVHCRVVLA